MGRVSENPLHFVWPLTKDVVILQTGSLNLEFGSMMAQSMLEETLFLIQ